MTQGKRRKAETEALAGREYARRWYELPELCERCQEAPPRDRHHKDGDTTNNAPGNIAFLCRRCHQAVDGRVEILRANGLTKRECDSCKRGHPFDDANTYWNKGKRGCKECRRVAWRRWKAKKA